MSIPVALSLLPRRRDTGELTFVLDAVGVVGHHLVALRDEELVCAVKIESGEIGGEQLFECLAASDRSRGTDDMADVSTGMPLIDDVHVLLLPRLFYPAQNDLLVLFGGHYATLLSLKRGPVPVVGPAVAQRASLSPGLGLGFALPWPRHHAELAHQIQLVPLLPLRRDLPLGQAEDAHAAESGPFPGRRDAEQLPLLRPLGHPAHRNLVPFCDHVLAPGAQIGKCGSVHRPLAPGSFQPGRLPGQSTVVHVVLRDLIIGPIQPLLVEDLLKPAPDDRLVLLGGHEMGSSYSGSAVRRRLRYCRSGHHRAETADRLAPVSA